MREPRLPREAKMKIAISPLIIICIVVNLLGLVIFLHGFFPVKRSIPGHATPENITEPPWWPSEDPPSIISGEPHRPLYDRLVLVLIDALRVDFVLPSSGKSALPTMTFVSELLSSGAALGYTARAHVPTVTMPRIKALTTGGIPGFIDVVLNFDSKSLQEDNLISQLRHAGKRIVFYGDDTWMGLFPEHFERAEGTTSFFVTDYTQVDLNVSRHVVPELDRDDWDVMILHYLGLDHIGHLAGPRSPLVEPKLSEMDNIVRLIYDHVTLRDAVSGQSTLLLLCGDHGMSDQGSHGGSSDSEVFTPLVLMGGNTPQQADKATIIDQIDAAPTLALALGLPVPQNSLGTFIIDVVRGMSPRDRLKAAYSNAQQLLKILEMNVQDFENEPCYLQLTRAIDSHKSWLLSLDQDPDSDALNALSNKILDLYHQALRAVGERVSGTLAEYDLHSMAAGILMLWMVVVLLLALFRHTSDTSGVPASALNILAFFLLACLLTFANIFVCTSVHGSDSLCTHRVAALMLVAAIVVFVSASFVFILSSWKQGSETIYNCWLLRPLTTAGVLYTVSLLSSSFVEEEHQTWYFFTVTALILYSVYSLGDLGHNGKRPGDMKVAESAWYSENAGVEMNENARSNAYVEVNSAASTLKLRGRTQKIKSDETKAKSATEQTDSAQREASFTLLSYAAMALVLCRVARSWNQTGDKWAHLPDVGDWLVMPENKSILSSLVAVSLVLAICLVSSRTRSVTMTTLYTLGVMAMYAFRAESGALTAPWVSGAEISSGVTEARFAYLIITFILCHTFYNIYKDRKELTTGSQKSPVSKTWHCHISLLVSAAVQLQAALSLFALLILRPHNIILAVFVFYLQYFVSALLRNGLEISVPSLTLVFYCLGQASFYYQGNSNSIATVDVSAGYVGLSDYNPTVIGLLMALSTYVFPIFWHLSLLHAILHRAKTSHWQPNRLRQSLTTCVITIALCRTIPLAVYVVMVTAQRYHLFVWSVFSPKLLYEGMHTVVASVLMCATLLLRQTL